MAQAFVKVWKVQTGENEAPLTIWTNLTIYIFIYIYKNPGALCRILNRHLEWLPHNHLVVFLKVWRKSPDVIILCCRYGKLLALWPQSAFCRGKLSVISSVAGRVTASGRQSLNILIPRSHSICLMTAGFWELNMQRWAGTGGFFGFFWDIVHWHFFPLCKNQKSLNTTVSVFLLQPHQFFHHTYSTENSQGNWPEANKRMRNKTCIWGEK